MEGKVSERVFKRTAHIVYETFSTDFNFFSTYGLTSSTVALTQMFQYETCSDAFVLVSAKLTINLDY